MSALAERMGRRNGHKCQTCGVTMSATIERVGGQPTGPILDQSPSVDHIVPRSWGGATDPSNLQVICNKCQRMKHEDEKTLVRSVMAGSRTGPSAVEAIRAWRRT